MNRKDPDGDPPAHHCAEGGFRNPWPLPAQHGFGAALKWMLSRQRSHDESTPTVVRAAARVPAPDGTDLAVTWIGHSTFLIQSSGISVLTDPMWSSRASPVQFAGPRRVVPPALAFDKLPEIDAVFISHDHYDHLDSRTIRRIVRRWPQASWFAPLGVKEFLTRRGAARVAELDWWQKTAVDGVSACCTPAMHFSGRYPWNRNATLWCGWVIGIGVHRVFFAGDTALHPDFGAIARSFGPFDAAILPIGAYEPRWFMRAVHMDPEESVAAYCQLVAAESGECVFIPSHWGTFRLTDEPLEEPPQRLRKAWADTGLPDTRLFILQHGETTP